MGFLQAEGWQVEEAFDTLLPHLLTLPAGAASTQDSYRRLLRPGKPRFPAEVGERRPLSPDSRLRRPPAPVGVATRSRS